MGALQGLGLQGRAHQAVHAGLLRKGGQAQDLLLGLDVQADAGQIFTFHAGEHGDADQQRFGTCTLIQHLAAGCHHAQAAGAMHVDHPHAHFCGSLDRHGGGVGNVVELQVQEHFETLVAKGPDNLGGTAGEQLLADFDPAQFRVQLIGQFQCGVTGGEIQGDDDRSLAGGHEGALRQVEIGADCSASRGDPGPDAR
ncbi:hypothetical protein BLX41_03550 [Pseudomonas protegens]|nr:hypothetical protein BLX41_03550 [Pseudomonas protegens]